MCRLQFLRFIWSLLAVIALQIVYAWIAPDPSPLLSSLSLSQSYESTIDAFEGATAFLLEEPSGLQESQSKLRLMPLHRLALLTGRHRGHAHALQRTRSVPVASLRQFVPRKLLPSPAPEDPLSFSSPLRLALPSSVAPCACPCCVL